MFAYCLNSPVESCDPTGYYRIVRRDVCSTFFGNMLEGGAGGIGYASAAGAGMLMIGISLTDLFLEAMSAISRCLNSINLPNFFANKTESTETQLGDIASSFGMFQCTKAAESMAEYLRSKGKSATLVTICYINGRGYIWSDTVGKVISENGVHVGILYNGIVYCNVHPFGMPEMSWIADFHGTGIKTVQKVPI